MAQSIKLTDNLYWDQTAIKGGSRADKTFTVNDTYVNNGANIKIYTKLGMVCLQISANLKAMSASTSGYKIGTIPSDIYPPTSAYGLIRGIASNSTKTALVSVGASGDVNVYTPDGLTAGWYDGQVNWIL